MKFGCVVYLAQEKALHKEKTRFQQVTVPAFDLDIMLCIFLKKIFCSTVQYSRSTVLALHRSLTKLCVKSPQNTHALRKYCLNPRFSPKTTKHMDVRMKM